MFGIVQVKREIIARHHPVQLRGNHPRKGDFRARDLALELVLRAPLPGIHKRAQIIFQSGIRGQNREDIRVGLVQKFDGVRERAVFPAPVNPQIPDNCRKQDNRRLHEEITLFLYPGLVQIEHDGIGTFIGVRDVRHEFRVDGIATVRAARVIEIDDVKFGLHLVFVEILEQFVVGDNGEVIEFVVIDIYSEPFGYLLFDIAVYHRETLSRSGSAQHDSGPERIDDIDPAVPFFLLVHELGGQIYRVFVFHQDGVLHE